METINKTLSEQERNEAINFQNFRNECKKYLANHDNLHDKFTITPNDAYIAYVTEKFIINYLRNKYNGKIKVSTWSEDESFDLNKVREIITNNSCDPNDVNYVKYYFYDEYDLRISAPNHTVKIDVKTAITCKSPNDSWDFLYPVVQANKFKKDYVILVYYIAVNNNDPSTLKQLSIVGYISEEDISKCNIKYKDEPTKHKTINQTDNYETLISQYRGIDELIKNL